MIDILLDMPSFVKVALSFGAILVVYRYGLPLGWSIIAHALVLSVWTGAGVPSLEWQARGFIRPENYLLFVVIVLLLYFTEALNATGRMRRTVESLKQRISSYRALIGGLPALVGLLPMPGGALVSAPLVGSIDTDNEIEAPLKVAINYWFRHIWEYWWPLYPGVIVAIRCSGLPVGAYFLIMMPFTAVAAATGYFFILRRVPVPAHWGKAREGGPVFNNNDVAATLGPIGLLVAVSVAGSILLPLAGVSSKLASLTAMLCGLIVGIPIIFGRDTGAFRVSLGMFKNPQVVSVMLVVIGVQMFSEALRMPLDSSGMTLVSNMRDEFIGRGVPIILVMMILPFIAGFVTGLAVGFVGASFPLVFALLGADPSFNELAATTVFAYSFGYMGMILSPIHICFVVTNEYFHNRLHRAYPYLAGPVISIVTVAIVFSAALYYIFKP